MEEPTDDTAVGEGTAAPPDRPEPVPPAAAPEVDGRDHGRDGGVALPEGGAAWA
ncbi:hypothetical protein H9L10_04080 [Phycicoccus endophyticus]|uniref:Uncharacterized protein n=1 Tax=Phycicoccus endophyticus TaxID=1690220 RepID=A0A7G9R3Q4_9MICO|nr:hypothetical protein [Phycicoccus endophyticus]NHI18051.1 hypothetical protein [Phycicoccus endophyticus]QNN50229.1 hypothetical protein H9L10_04080 [Phycicoccus endophyticus]